MNETTIQKALALIERRRKSLMGIDEDLATSLPIWTDRTLRLLSTVIHEAELRLMNGISTDTWEKDRIALGRFLSELESGIKEEPELYLVPETHEPALTVVDAGEQSSQPPTTELSRYVFVVHGHDSLAKVEVARTLEKLKLNPIVLHEQPNEGKTVIEKFERDASRVGFAVVILTPDDLGYPHGKPDDIRSRARQNVVLELGYFSAALGRSHVCVLYKGDVELPSDYLGVVYVPMDEPGNWRFALAKELKHVGLAVDLNDLV